MFESGKILKVIMKKYDNLLKCLSIYNGMHQKPTDGKKYNNYHWHIEFYPPYRTKKNKIKFLAGCESGAGTFINDTMAEEKS